ncbi:MAG: hypothetical protein C4287_16790, partial [Leptolyngbya sp. ERB_1_2]
KAHRVALVEPVAYPKDSVSGLSGLSPKRSKLWNKLIPALVPPVMSNCVGVWLIFVPVPSFVGVI